MQFVPLYRQQSGANLEPLPQIISLVRSKSTSAVAPNLVPCASPSRFCAMYLFRFPTRGGCGANRLGVASVAVAIATVASRFGPFSSGVFGC